MNQGRMKSERDEEEMAGHRLLLKGVLVQDSFVEKVAYFRLLDKIVGKRCLTWNRIGYFYQLKHFL